MITFLFVNTDMVINATDLIPQGSSSLPDNAFDGAFLYLIYPLDNNAEAYKYSLSKILGLHTNKKNDDFKISVNKKYLFWGLIICIGLLALLLVLIEKLYSRLKNNRELMDLDKINEKIFKKEQKENNGVFDTN